MTLTKKETKIKSIIDKRLNNGEILEDIIQEYVDDVKSSIDWVKENQLK